MTRNLIAEQARREARRREASADARNAFLGLLGLVVGVTAIAWAIAQFIDGGL